jgi:cytochrome c oxidase subunit 1
VSVPTLLTIFTITASLEIAGRLRGGRGIFGWIAKLPWDRPAVLATGLAFVMLGFGGFGGLINMGYGMNAMVHNTSWVTAHFHLIFRRLGRHHVLRDRLRDMAAPHRPRACFARPLRLQLWLWFIGMMVMTVPWHWLGLAGPMAARRQFQLCRSHHRRLGTVGSCLALRLVRVACLRAAVRPQSRVLHRSPLSAVPRPLYALAVHPPHRVPARSTALDSGTCWSWS